MEGWRKCEQLKNIRKRIADLNGIPYEPIHCEHKEDCIGTCPKCDEEIMYISDELLKLENAGRLVTVDNIADGTDVSNEVAGDDTNKNTDSEVDLYEANPMVGGIDFEYMIDKPLVKEIRRGGIHRKDSIDREING